MNRVLRGPWIAQAARTVGKGEAATRAVLVALVVLLAGFLAHVGLATAEASERPSSVVALPLGDGVWYLEQENAAGQVLTVGAWRADVPAGRTCGYRRVALGNDLSTNSRSTAGTLSVSIPARTLYAEFTGGCTWLRVDR